MQHIYAHGAELTSERAKLARVSLSAYAHTHTHTHEETAVCIATP